MSDTTTKLSCNRLPFVSDDSCDRGSVDIGHFADLPACESYDPPVPDVPVPSTDFPVIVIPPPPCTCFNITYDIKGTPKPVASVTVNKAEFKAIGDCCAGNYKTTFDLNIPCIPFTIGTDSKSPSSFFSFLYSWGRKAKSDFNISVTQKDCAIELKPEINLEIPCPVYDFDIKNADGSFAPTAKQRKLKTSLTFSQTKAGATEGGACQIGQYTPQLDVTVPCAIDVGSKDINLFGSAQKSGWGSGQLHLMVDQCALTAVTSDLNIPCPVKDIKLKPTMAWTQKNTQTEQTIVKADSSGCDMTAGSFNLNIPCPVKDISLTPSLKWTKDQQPAQTLIKAGENCEMAAGSFALNVPCPVTSVSMTPQIHWSDAAQKRQDLITADPGSACAMHGSDGTFDINISCPISGFGIGSDSSSIKPTFGQRTMLTSIYFPPASSFGSYGFGDAGSSGACKIRPLKAKIKITVPCAVDLGKDSSSHIVPLFSKDQMKKWGTGSLHLKTDLCSLVAVTSDLNIPCPLENLRFKVVDSSKQTSSTGYIRFTPDETSSTCGRNYNVKIGFPPNGVSGYMPPRPFDLVNVVKGATSWTTTDLTLTCKLCRVRFGGKSTIVAGGNLSLSQSVTAGGTLYVKASPGTDGMTIGLTTDNGDDDSDDTVFYAPLYTFTYTAPTGTEGSAMLTITSDLRGEIPIIVAN